MQLPVFPEFEIVGLKHKELLLEYFQKNNPVISELNFLEIFAWRNLRDIRISDFNGNMIFKIKKKGGYYLYPPLDNNPGKILFDVLSYYKEKKEEVNAIAFPDDYTEKLGEYKDKFVFEDDRANYDYLYLSEKLVSLSGRKFDGKRNHLRKFNRLYEYECFEITPEIIPEVIEFQERWCKMRPCDDDMSLANESEAVKEMLDNYAELPVRGTAIKIKGQVEAYTLISVLNSDTAVVVVEKANQELRGIYQAINNMCCTNLISKYKHINRQQDTGDEGLRKAKMSYVPDRLIKKYILKLK